jgi:hypothetical protein
MTRSSTAAFLVALLPAIALAQTQGEEVQILTNTSFEDGLQGWEFWPDESNSTMNEDTDVAYEGSASLRIDAPTPADRAFVLQSSDLFEPGVIYRISVAIRKDASIADSTVGFIVNYRAEDGTILQRANPMALQKEPLDEGWERWSGLFFNDTEGVATWQVLLRVEYAVGSVWFDDLRFERLGPPDDVAPDVWSYWPVGVEIGAGPATRFTEHKEQQTPAWQAAVRYNDLLMRAGTLDARLREVNRCAAYAGEQPSEQLNGSFAQMEARLNDAYGAFAGAFRSEQDEDWQSFNSAADRLDANLELLSAQVRSEYNRLRPPRLRLLPEGFGEQSRDIPPFRADGAMNRLLIGAWSPTGWSEFERPFDFEFHSSAPGAPRVHTETERDFSNIAEACDNLEALGYDGTFGYLSFGIHDMVYAPEWLLEKHADDPDFFKVSQDGLIGRSSGSTHSLNYYHPAVREYIRDYLSAYAEFCADEPRIFFHEIAQEAYPYFSAEGGRRQPGYGPSATAAFHQWLEAEYGTVGALNQAWGSDYASFAEIEQPDDRFINPDRQITPLVAEFERFIEDGYLDYLQLIYDSLKAGDPDKPVAARHSALLSSINGARAFEHCDVLSYHRPAPNMQMMNLYVNSLSRYNGGRPLGYLEDFWGTQEESDRITDERAQRRGLEKHVSRTFAWGRTLQMKWYAYTTGGYIFTYNGNWFDPRYDVLTMRYCAPGLKIALDRMRNVDWLLTHSEIPQFRVAVWQPSASMRTQARYGLSAAEIMALHQVIYPAGFAYEVVPEEYFADGRADVSDFDVVFLPTAEYLSEEHQRRLVEYVRGGGTLIAIEPPGVRDELARPSGLLLREVYGIEAPSFDADSATWDWQSARCTPGPLAMAQTGRGRAYITATTLGRALAEQGDQNALLDLLTRRVTRDAWARDARFEVLTRVADNGERYLFVLNPDPDERVSDRVLVSGQVAAATDVSVERGFPVPVRRQGGRSAIDCTLGPGEMAVLWLQ